MPVMESAIVPFESYSKSESENVVAGAKVIEANSNYMANMILPEIVQSSRTFPLGPQCIITNTDVPDQNILVDMDLYWYISLDKGCVECRVEVCDTGVTKKATTTDPRVIITRKPRRFEAYSCFLCRSSFVTIVQALLHMKAFHRQHKKILIQDQDVFHDIDKAMEVPPVPLPWYIAKKVGAEQGSKMNAYPIQYTEGQGIAGSENAGEVNPVTNLLQAIVKEYGKQVQTVLFGKDFSEVKVQFEDKTSVLAHLPDLVSQEENDIRDETEQDDKLEFKVYRISSEGEDEESCVVRMSNPNLAQRQIISALKQGVSQRGGDAPEQAEESPPENKEMSDILSESSTPIPTPVSYEPDIADTPPVQSPKKLDSKGRPSKTVRFMVGCPDSDDDGNSSTSERNVERDDTSKAPTITKDIPDAEEKKSKEDEGLRGVVSKLISTASKGRIPLDPTSPVTTVAPTPGVREEILATAAMHAQNLPKNLSVPNLSSFPGVSVAAVTPVITSLNAEPPSSTGMVRVQSWGGTAGPSNKFTLSTYAPNSLQKMKENMSTSELRQSFLTAGRGFTYAEKIRLMKKLNDEDSMITQAHVRGSVGKLALDNDSSSGSQPVKTQRGKTRKYSSSSALQDMETSDTPATSSVITMIPTTASTQEDTIAALKRKSGTSWQTDGRKKRKSKYDVDQFLKADLQTPIIEEPKKRRKASSSEGSDHDDKDISTLGNSEGREPNPASYIDVMRAAGLLPSRTGVFPSLVGQDHNASYPTMLQSEYYGSGEWASAAMQTLRNLQSTMEAVSAPTSTASLMKDEGIKKEQMDFNESDSSSGVPSPFTGAPQQTKDPVETKPDPNIPDNTILQIAKQIMDEKMMNESQSAKDKRLLSPHVARKEKKLIKSRLGSASDSDPRLIKREKDVPDKGSKADSNTEKKSSKADMTSKASDTILAQKGDSLEFINDIHSFAINKTDKITMKYCDNNKKPSSSDPPSSSMEMPQIFQNSIDTFVKVRYIEKFSVCRVCGYTLSEEDSENGNDMASHVMEHSLKELLRTGCNGKPPNV